MEKVGTKGRYQWCVFALIFCLWVSIGFSLTNLSFLFLDPGFDCTALGITQIDCERYVCAHFQTQSARLQHQADPKIDSLLTEFGPFHC